MKTLPEMTYGEYKVYSERVGQLRTAMTHQMSLPFFRTLPGWECLDDFDLVVNINYNTQGYDLYYGELLIRQWVRQYPGIVLCFFEDIDKRTLPVGPISDLKRDINERMALIKPHVDDEK